MPVYDAISHVILQSRKKYVCIHIYIYMINVYVNWYTHVCIRLLDRDLPAWHLHKHQGLQGSPGNFSVYTYLDTKGYTNSCTSWCRYTVRISDVPDVQSFWIITAGYQRMTCQTIVAAVPRWLWLKMKWSQNWLLWWSPESQKINPAAALKYCSHIYLHIRFVAMVCKYVFTFMFRSTYYIHIPQSAHITCMLYAYKHVYILKFHEVLESPATFWHHFVATFASSRAFCWSPKPGEEPGKIITTSSSRLG